jgi:hypothetical protein
LLLCLSNFGLGGGKIDVDNFVLSDDRAVRYVTLAQRDRIGLQRKDKLEQQNQAHGVHAQEQPS